MGYLVIREEDVKRIFLDEIAIIVIENPAVALTGCLLEAIAERKIKLIVCNSSHDPVAELIPHHGCHDSTLKIRNQIAWSKTVKDLVWREIVAEKIRQQANVLLAFGKTDEVALLNSYISQIEPGDVSNREGHAAKVYFNALFGMEFTRSSDDTVNSALDYGYSILLSAFNREISANGYLTQLGIFHDNMFNHFNLGCDLMEPLRPLVDYTVRSIMPTQFTKDEKHSLWQIMSETVEINGSNQTLLNAIRIYTKSVFNALNEKDVSKIHFPKLL